jgi:hypothetical protein
MKKKLLRITLLIFATIICFAKESKAQEPELQFEYDAAGNQIKRDWVCIGCSTFPVSLASRDNSSEMATIPDAKKNTASTQRSLLAYPNPLTEILNVKWKYADKYHVNKIEVFSVGGITFFKQDYTNDIDQPILQVAIPFQRQLPGMYVLRVSYSDGKQETIKVIKK